MSITTRAAIARAPHVGWEIADLQLDEPKAHEVRVKLMAAGLCHSDDHITTGDAPIRLPVVGGHEGAGIVESVGPNVQRVKPGDKIVCSYIPACGACRPCSTGHQNMCVKGLNAGTGMFEDGTWRFHLGDQDLGGFCTLAPSPSTPSCRSGPRCRCGRTSRTFRGRSCAWSAAVSRPAGAPPCTRRACRRATRW